MGNPTFRIADGGRELFWWPMLCEMVHEEEEKKKKKGGCI